MENQTAASSTPGRLLLDGVPTLRRACYLDLLLFFARHPVSLLTSEQLAAFVGYDHNEVAESLERLSSAGIVTRTDRPTSRDCSCSRLAVRTAEDCHRSCSLPRPVRAESLCCRPFRRIAARRAVRLPRPHEQSGAAAES